MLGIVRGEHFYAAHGAEVILLFAFCVNNFPSSRVDFVLQGILSFNLSNFTLRAAITHFIFIYIMAIYLFDLMTRALSYDTTKYYH